MRVDPKQIIRIYKGVGKVRETARQLGIDPSTVSRWLKRARSVTGYLSTRGLGRKSTRPHRIRYGLPSSVLATFVRLRRENGYSAQKLMGLVISTVHHRTVHRALARLGLIAKYSFYRRPRFQDTVHMHVSNTPTVGYLQMDVKYITPELSGLAWTCYEYAVIDIFSRYKAAVILNHLDQDGSILALIEILPTLPLKPVFVQTDNGLEFQQRFHRHLDQIGLQHHHVHKKNPNENAVIERSFRTDEEEFFYRLPRRPKHYDELREWFALYLTKYNTFRPHLSLELKTPAQVVAEVVSQ